MALKVELKPNERIIIGGCVITNIDQRARLLIEGERVAFLWKNRLPGRRADGSHYEFSGVTTMLYAGGGRFSYQEDIYNFDETKKVMAEWAADQKRDGARG